MSTFNKHPFIHNLRSKLLLILLAFTCSQASAVFSFIEDDTPGVENCPDGIRPAKSTEQLVNNVMLLSQKSFDYQDYVTNLENLKCHFKKSKILWIAFHNGTKEYSGIKKDDSEQFILTTRVEGQLFEVHVSGIGPSSEEGFMLTLKGKDESPVDVNLITTMQKYFPDLEAKFNYKAKFSIITDVHLDEHQPHLDIADGKKPVTGKVYSGRYGLRYNKMLDDGKCFNVPNTNRKNCSFKEEANLFTLKLYTYFEKQTPPKNQLKQTQADDNDTQ